MYAILPGKLLDDGYEGLLREVAGPCPELLTEDEAIRYLRLDEAGGDAPTKTLARYRSMGRLHGTQVGRNIRYRRIELERFLERQTQLNPR